MKNMMFLLLPLLVLSCTTTSTVTNLTSSKAKRSPNNLYLVEYAWTSNQQSIRPDSIKPQVVIGMDTYPMRKVPKMQNRWEAYIPAAPTQKTVLYHIKVDYEYNAFGKRGKDSIKTEEYKLTIED